MFVKFRQNFIKISKKNTNFNAFFMKFELNKLFKVFKNDKIVTTFLLKFWDLSGAKVWKSCRSRKSWKNEYLVAIVAVDTAENGPPKVWPNWINYSVVSLITSLRTTFHFRVSMITHDFLQSKLSSLLLSDALIQPRDDLPTERTIDRNPDPVEV